MLAVIVTAKLTIFIEEWKQSSGRNNEQESEEAKETFQETMDNGHFKKL